MLNRFPVRWPGRNQRWEMNNECQHHQSRRDLTIIRKLRITKTHGLKRPWRDKVSPFLWSREFSTIRLFWVRFAWNPRTGTMILGTNPACFRDADIIPRSRRYGFVHHIECFSLYPDVCSHGHLWLYKNGSRVPALLIPRDSIIKIREQ